MSAAIPEGLKPVGVWDCSDPGGTWWTAGYLQRIEWAKTHIERPDDTFRLDFYLLDAPFAVVRRFKVNEDGRKIAFGPDGEPVTEEPVVQMLDELPPAHLLERR